MNIKSNFVKVTAAAALTLTGVATVSAVKPDSTTANVQAATTKVKINYVPGYGINIWDNYNMHLMALLGMLLTKQLTKKAALGTKLVKVNGSWLNTLCQLILRMLRR